MMESIFLFIYIFFKFFNSLTELISTQKYHWTVINLENLELI